MKPDRNKTDITTATKKELDIRLKNFDEGKTQLYSWKEVKVHLETVRNKIR